MADIYIHHIFAIEVFSSSGSHLYLPQACHRAVCQQWQTIIFATDFLLDMFPNSSIFSKVCCGFTTTSEKPQSSFFPHYYHFVCHKFSAY